MKYDRFKEYKSFIMGFYDDDIELEEIIKELKRKYNLSVPLEVLASAIQGWINDGYTKGKDYPEKLEEINKITKLTNEICKMVDTLAEAMDYDKNQKKMLLLEYFDKFGIGIPFYIAPKRTPFGKLLPANLKQIEHYKSELLKLKTKNGWSYDSLSKLFDGKVASTTICGWNSGAVPSPKNFILVKEFIDNYKKDTKK